MKFSIPECQAIFYLQKLVDLLVKCGFGLELRRL